MGAPYPFDQTLASARPKPVLARPQARPQPSPWIKSRPIGAGANTSALGLELLVGACGRPADVDALGAAAFHHVHLNVTDTEETQVYYERTSTGGSGTGSRSTRR